MQHEVIDRLVEEVLRRMRPRSLLLLTAADGYREIIYTRLRHCQTQAFSVAIAENARALHAQLDWAAIGPSVHPQHSGQPGFFDGFAQILVPFLDFATAAEVANGLFSSDGAQVIHYALMSGKPVLALDYNCNPTSELNQLKGLARSGEPPVSLPAGIRCCTLDSMLAPTTAEPSVDSAPAFITLSELKRRNGYCPPGARLTDLAQEYARANNNGFK